jgi:chaperonin cofactor prefoldin
MLCQQHKAATTETCRQKNRDVASRYYDELESELQGVQAQPRSLDEKFKNLEETIQRVAINTIG